jgi:hypothetical protein
MNIYGTDYTDQATAQFAQMRDQQARAAYQQVGTQPVQVDNSGSAYIQNAANFVQAQQHQNFENNLHAAEMAGAIYVGTKLIGAHQANQASGTVRTHTTVNWGFVLGLIIAFVVLYAMAH